MCLKNACQPNRRAFLDHIMCQSELTTIAFLDDFMSQSELTAIAMIVLKVAKRFQKFELSLKKKF